MDTHTITPEQAARRLAALVAEARVLTDSLKEATEAIFGLAEIGERLERDGHGDRL